MREIELSLKNWKYITLLAWVAVGSVYAITKLLPDNNDVKAEVSSVRAGDVEKAREAAHAGMSHFIAHHLSNNEIESGILVPETRYGKESAYEVETTWNDAGQVVVMSRGRYIKAESDIVEYPIRVVFNPEKLLEE